MGVQVRELTKQLTCKLCPTVEVFSFQCSIQKETNQWDALWDKVCLAPTDTPQTPKIKMYNHENTFLKKCYVHNSVRCTWVSRTVELEHSVCFGTNCWTAYNMITFVK